METANQFSNLRATMMESPKRELVRAGCVDEIPKYVFFDDGDLDDLVSWGWCVVMRIPPHDDESFIFS